MAGHHVFSYLTQTNRSSTELSGPSLPVLGIPHFCIDAVERSEATDEEEDIVVQTKISSGWAYLLCIFIGGQ